MNMSREDRTRRSIVGVILAAILFFAAVPFVEADDNDFEPYGEGNCDVRYFRMGDFEETCSGTTKKQACASNWNRLGPPDCTAWVDYDPISETLSGCSYNGQSTASHGVACECNAAVCLLD
jgi:hypothetical protein